MSGGTHVTIGVDLGGTKVEVAMVDAGGQILSGECYPTNPDKGSVGIITDIRNAVNKLQDGAEQEAVALGIGVAGQINLRGDVMSSPHLPLRNEPLQERLEKELALPTRVVNDVNAATYGEWRHGSAKGQNEVVVIFVGTGIGGGVISRGKLLEGCNGTAGELGHITLVSEGRHCRCPNHGCLEAYAGGWAIAERAQEAVYADPEGGALLVSLAEGVENITAAVVGAAYREGNQLANQLVEETGRYLAYGTVGIINTFNPCLLVLGGGVIEGLPELIPIVEEITQKHALRPNMGELKIVRAALGSKAGAIGAAAIAQDIPREK